MKMELRKSFQFEAAHLLPRLPKAHKCRRLHGHSFRVEIAVAGECDEKLGWLMDYAELSAAFRPLWEKLDHRYLNQVPGLANPTSEVIAVWIWKKLKPRLPLLSEVVVAPSPKVPAAPPPSQRSAAVAESPTAAPCQANGLRLHPAVTSARTPRRTPPCSA